MINRGGWLHVPRMPADDLAPVLERTEGGAASAGRYARRVGHSKQRLRDMVTAHHATVWRFLRRLGLDPSDADDAMQDVLLVAMRKLDVIDPQHERSFLLGTAYRVGSRIRAKRPKVSDESLPDPTPHPDVLVDQKRARELLDDILSRMPEDLRAVFVLHDIERLTMADIARALALKPGTVASRLRRARADFEKRVTRVEKRMKEKSA